MHTDPKRFILAACLSAAIACTGLTGCETQKAADTRTAGTQMDDKHTEERVRDALDHDPVYKFQNVNVQVYEGVAQLSGFTDTTAQKTSAAEVAARVQGVRQLINGIVVKPPEAMSPAGYEYGRPYPAATSPAPAQAPASGKTTPQDQPNQ